MGAIHPTLRAWEHRPRLPMAFVSRILNYLVNEVMVNSLANR